MQAVKNGQTMLDFSQNSEAANNDISLAEHADSQNIPTEEVKLEDQNPSKDNPAKTMTDYEKMEDSIKEEAQNKLDTISCEIVEVDVNLLHKLDDHARVYLGDIKRLEESFRLKGPITPPKIIETKSGRLEVFDGWRSTKAAQNVGYKKITCLKYLGLTKEEAANRSFLCNEAQKTLTDIEKAQYVKKHIDKGLSHRQIATMLCYGSSTTVHNLYQLNFLSPSIQSDISCNKLDSTKALLLTKLPTDELRETISKKVQQKGLSVQATKKAVEEALELLEKEGESPDDDQNQATEFSHIYLRHQPKMSGEVEHESADLAVFTIPAPSRFKCSSRHDVQKYLNSLTETIIETASAIKKGGNVALLFQDYPDVRPGMPFVSSTLILPYFAETLRRRNVDMVGRVTVSINNKLLLEKHKEKLSEQDHTQFIIREVSANVVFFRKGAGREDVSQESIEQSVLPDDELLSLTDCVWTLENDDAELCQVEKNLCDRVIRLSTFVDDIVLFPNCFNTVGIAAAHSAGRKVIGYFNEPDYRRNELVEIFGEPSKSVRISPLVNIATSYPDCAASPLGNKPKDINDITEMTANQSV